tara:strand:- start:723 stop:1817 length:1095 start_codon:yes stop_codon:yes gene_type:complete
MILKEIIDTIEAWAPPSLQESYDNSGLLYGHKDMEVDQALLSLDCTENVVEEAIEKNCQLIISHHPIVFSGIKKLNGKNYIERTLIKAIRHNIALYAIHTNLDNIKEGVNSMIAKKLGLPQGRVLRPKKGHLKKLVFFCPKDASESVKEALFNVGAGVIGDYDCCSFESEGQGNFRARSKSTPNRGRKGELHYEEELRIETVYPFYLESKLLDALQTHHPYEEVAYDIYTTEIDWKQVGSGWLAEYEAAIPMKDFITTLKKEMNVAMLRHTKFTSDSVKRIALCGGSGSFLLADAIKAKADVFITGDFKYHQFFDAEDSICIMDIGHYESEQFTPQLLQEFLQKKIPNFATYLSKVNTNPINYA